MGVSNMDLSGSTGIQVRVSSVEKIFTFMVALFLQIINIIFQTKISIISHACLEGLKD